MRPILRESVTVLVVMVASTAYADVFERQYKAVMSAYFIRNHYSVPLFDNGSIEKGDLIQYPEEAVIKKRDECFDLGKTSFRNISALDITLANDLDTSGK